MPALRAPGDPLLEHWVTANKGQERPRLSLAPKQTSRHAWLWDSDAGRTMADVYLRLRPLPKALGENAEELAAKMQETSDDQEYALHAVVLAAGSLYFRDRLLKQVALENHLVALHHQHHQHQAAKGPSSSTPGASVITGSGASGSETAASNTSSGAQGAGGVSAGGGLMGSSTGAGGVRVIEERLAPADLDAARAVLRHMYTDELHVESPSQLVVALKIADKWRAEETVEACRCAFARLKPEQIDLDVLKRVYALEGIVNDVANFSELLAAVQARLVTMFADVVEVIRNPVLQAQFLQLPFAAMLALLRSEQLVVDSENSVMVAATLWMTRGRGRYSTPEQKRYIAGAIRLSALTPSFLCGVLPNIKWFTWPQASPAPFYATLQARMVTPEARQVLVSSSIPPVSVVTHNPGSASSSAGRGASPDAAQTSGSALQQQQQQQLPPGVPRSSSSTSLGGVPAAVLLEPPRRLIKEQNLELVCDIDEARLKEYLVNGVAALRAHPEGFRGIHVQSETSYFRGYLWGIKVVFGFSAGSQLLPQTSSAQAGVGSGASNARRGTSSSGSTPTASAPTTPMRQGSGASSSSSGRAAGGPQGSGGNAAGNGHESSPAFTVTPSVFASLPPGEEGMLPLVTPVTVSFKCTLEAIGAYGSPYSSSTFCGASFIKPGEDSVASIGVLSFFKKISQPHLIDSWRPFLCGGKLRLKLSVVGATVE